MEMIIVIGMVDMEIDKLADEVADMVADMSDEEQIPPTLLMCLWLVLEKEQE